MDTFTCLNILCIKVVTTFPHLLFLDPLLAFVLINLAPAVLADVLWQSLHQHKHRD